MTVKLASIYLVTDVCAACGDTMNDHDSNHQPTWSDTHDDVVCWWCATHDEVSA